MNGETETSNFLSEFSRQSGQHVNIVGGFEILRVPNM